MIFDLVTVILIAVSCLCCGFAVGVVFTLFAR